MSGDFGIGVFGGFKCCDDYPDCKHFPLPTAKSLRDKLELDLKELQAKCKHREISEWMEQHWAIGHYSGTDVKLCNKCEKIIETRNNMIDVDMGSGLE